MPRIPNVEEILSTLRGGRNLHNYSPEGGGVSESLHLPSGGTIKLYITRPNAPGFEGGHPEISWELDGATGHAVFKGQLNRRTVAREAINALADRLKAHARQHNISAYTFMPISESRRRLNQGMAGRRMKDYEYIPAKRRTDRPRDPITGKAEPSINDILVKSPSLYQDIALGLAGTAPIGALALAFTEEGQEFLRPDAGPRRPSDFLSGDTR